MTGKSPLLAAAAAAILIAHAAAAAAPPTKLTIAYSQTSADELSLWITLDAGYFKQHGLDVTEQLLAAQQGIPALLTGEVQFASIGAGDSLSAVAQGLKLKYVAAYAPIFEFEFWARPDHTSAAALKGQKVGVPSITGTAYITTVLALQDLGLTPGDVALTPLGTAQNVAAALIAGSIAAGSEQAPMTYEFAKLKFTLLVDLLPKKVPNVTTGLVALDGYIASHRAIVQQAVDAFAEGLTREKTDKAFTEQVMKRRLGIVDQGQLDQTYTYFTRAIDQDLPMPETNMLAAAQSVMGMQNPKVKAIDLNTMIDQSFVKTLVASQPGGKP